MPTFTYVQSIISLKTPRITRQIWSSFILLWIFKANGIKQQCIFLKIFFRRYVITNCSNMAKYQVNDLKLVFKCCYWSELESKIRLRHGLADCITFNINYTWDVILRILETLLNRTDKPDVFFRKRDFLRKEHLSVRLTSISLARKLGPPLYCPRQSKLPYIRVIMVKSVIIGIALQLSIMLAKWRKTNLWPCPNGLPSLPWRFRRGNPARRSQCKTSPPPCFIHHLGTAA